jgi:adenine-specific DNA-methyltransferase
MNTLSENTIVLGDCVQVMQQIPSGSVNFILTDPPYLVSYKDRSGRSIKNDDNDAWLKPSIAEMYRVLARNSFCISFYGWPHIDRFMAAWKAAGFRIVGHLVFPKGYTSNTRHLRYQHECAYLLAKGYPSEPANPIGDVVTSWKYTGNRLHPTEKPQSILRPLVETFSKPGGLVCDPFSGSGSTLHTAKSLGRNYLGIELDPQYHARASKRLEAVT